MTRDRKANTLAQFCGGALVLVIPPLLVSAPGAITINLSLHIYLWYPSVLRTTSLPSSGIFQIKLLVAASSGGDKMELRLSFSNYNIFLSPPTYPGGGTLSRY